MRDFYNMVCKYKTQVFSVDKITSDNNEAGKVIVRFNNGRTITKFIRIIVR